MKPRRQAGFTLIELSMAVAVVGILASLAIPSLFGAMEAGRASAAKTALLGAVMQSATRAAVTDRHVVLCPGDRSSCAAGHDWTSGWLAFVDRDGNRELDAGESVLLTEPALPGRVRLTSTAGRTRLVFQPSGGNGGSNVTFTLCDGRGARRAETFVLNNRGGMRYGAATVAGVAATCPQ